MGFVKRVLDVRLIQDDSAVVLFATSGCLCGVPAISGNLQTKVRVFGRALNPKSTVWIEKGNQCFQPAPVTQTGRIVRISFGSMGTRRHDP